MIYQYSGVIHVHSNYSDGSADFNGIAKAARKSGAKFILINDHDTLEGLYQQGEQYLHDVLILVGAEVSPPRNHFLCYDINSVPCKKQMPAQYVKEVYEQGGFGFLAHPDQKENPIFQGRMNWDNWDLDMPFGLEIWNFFSQWMSSFKNIQGLLISFLFPKATLRAPQPETLRKWDLLGKQRPVPVIAGVDAHGGRQFNWVPNILSSYKYQFNTLRTHILSEEPLQGIINKDRKIILSAIKKGRCYLVNHCVGNVKGFLFYLQHLNDKWFMGEEVRYRPEMTLNIILSEKAHVKLIKDGRVFWQGRTKAVHMPNPETGVYRVEVYKGSIWRRPWIFSNHIYIRPAGHDHVQ
ncbi:CehA/McbA family metallohydrolase [Desulfotomaculum defluvii]